MRKWQALIQETRAPFLTASLVPVLIGTAVAYRSTGQVHAWDLFWLLLAFAGFHLGTNVMNDFFDHRQGTDEVNREYVFPFSGGSRMIQKKLLTPREVWWEAVLFWVLGMGAGTVLAFRHGMILMPVWALVFVSGFFYTAPPFRWVHHGWGEFWVGLNFGPLIILTTYWVQTGTLAWEPFWVSLPVLLWVTAILFINQFPDYRADSATGKHNWVVRLGRKQARWAYAAMMAGAYLCLGGLLAWGHEPRSLYWAWLTLPLAWLSIQTVWAHYETPQKLAPACGLTILVHLAGGLIFSAAYFF